MQPQVQPVARVPRPKPRPQYTEDDMDRPTRLLITNQDTPLIILAL
jgi:hypothetical protein